ncbi:MAG: M15 family metallopeptidase [Clostridia bacterium]|nr:M15 family metallopeptidase [Clostridia bacterium]
MGLAVDIVSDRYQTLDKKQENTPVQKWLMEHCVDYGFILRYPTYKKDTTKINYEPWHYRYVGVENAKFMQEKNFCLEEYIEYLSKD